MHMFKSRGEHLATLGTHFSGPAGIAIDEDGFVYVFDYDSSTNHIIVF